METVRLSVNDLAVNQGQIEGLPVNPRQWTKADVDKLAKSLQETPELFEMRPCIVVPYSGKYIVLGGNMRLTAAQSLKLKDVPCIVMPENTPVDKLKEIVIKDNGTFGAWDYDMLANEWDDLPLTKWGVPAWNTEDEEMPNELDAEPTEKPFVAKITFLDDIKLNKFIDKYQDILKDEFDCTISVSGGGL